MLRLVLPDTRFIPSYAEALREGYKLGIRKMPSEDEIKEIEKDPFPYLDQQNYQGGIFTGEDGIVRKRVPHNLYWLIENDEFVGGASLRYELNDLLKQQAGHIGYGIRPSKRGQGYAKKLLALSLSILKDRGLDRVMLGADESNIASWKTIEANGGALEKKVDSIFHKGSQTRVYWIDLVKQACEAKSQARQNKINKLDL